MFGSESTSWKHNNASNSHFRDSGVEKMERNLANESLPTSSRKITKGKPPAVFPDIAIVSAEAFPMSARRNDSTIYVTSIAEVDKLIELKRPEEDPLARNDEVVRSVVPSEPRCLQQGQL